MKAMNIFFKKHSALLITTLLGVCTLVTIVTFYVVGHQNVDKTPRVISKNKIMFTVDHKTYSSLKELRGDADVVFVGTVLDNGRSFEDRVSDTSGDGTPAPSIVLTEFQVRVDTVLQGDIKVGDKLSVVLTGGTVNGTDYESDDMPWLKQSSEAIMYLQKNDAGKFYPLAGGAALAIKRSGGNFILPLEVSGQREWTVSPESF